MTTDLERFRRWFVDPVEKLKTLPNGDGAFAALSIGFLLCERYYRIVANTQEVVKDNKFKKAAAKDLNVNATFFQRFWSAYRNGLMHQGTPKVHEEDGIKYKWRIDDKYHEYPTYFDKGGFRYVCLNPWKFTDFMIAKFLGNPSRLNGSLIYQFGKILSDEPHETLTTCSFSQKYQRPR